MNPIYLRSFGGVVVCRRGEGIKKTVASGKGLMGL